MAIVAGIDEAGLGPVLGPLVVSTTAFRVDADKIDACLWTALAPAVSRKPDRKRLRIAVGDSKKLYNRKSARPLEHLERAVLSALHAARRQPHSVQGLLKVLSPAAARSVSVYPWYARSDLPLPHALSATEASLAGNALGVAMGEADVSLLAVRSEVICAAEFNRLVRATRSKSRLLGDITLRLLYYLREKAGSDLLTVNVDRQGARKHYLPDLQRLWPQGQFKVLDESDTHSAYRVTDGSRTTELHYTVGGEGRHLAVALASMVSKYAREMLMELFNRFWGEQIEDLAPTAGYYVDGNRFYEEIAGAMSQLKVEPDAVYRCK